MIVYWEIVGQETEVWTTLIRSGLFGAEREGYTRFRLGKY